MVLYIMKKALRIISVDGTRGSGKTSQISMLKKNLNSLGFNVKTLKTGIETQEIAETLRISSSFLDENQKNLVILDGSIARPMVVDLISGVSSVDVVEKYRQAMYEYERIDNRHGIVGLLLIVEDIEELQKRLENRARILGINSPDISLEKEPDIVSGMLTFNAHVVSKNVTFQVFNIGPKDSMLDVNKTILDYLTEKHDIPKLTKDDYDW